MKRLIDDFPGKFLNKFYTACKERIDQFSKYQMKRLPQKVHQFYNNFHKLK